MRGTRGRGCPLVAYTSQAQGFFGGKYGRGKGDPKATAMRLFYNEENLGRLERAQVLAARHGWSANDVALAYLLSQPFSVFPIVGCRTVEQVRASIAAAASHPHARGDRLPRSPMMRSN